MSRKEDEEREEREKEAKRAAKERARVEARSTREGVTVEPNLISGLPAEDYMTQQELGAPDPVTPPVDPVPAEILDIPRSDPYPTADTPPEA